MAVSVGDVTSPSASLALSEASRAKVPLSLPGSARGPPAIRAGLGRAIWHAARPPTCRRVRMWLPRSCSTLAPTLRQPALRLVAKCEPGWGASCTEGMGSAPGEIQLSSKRGICLFAPSPEAFPVHHRPSLGSGVGLHTGSGVGTKALVLSFPR